MSLGLDLALAFGAASAIGKAVHMRKALEKDTSMASDDKAFMTGCAALGFGIAGAVGGAGIGMGLQDVRIVTPSISMEDCIDLAKKNGSKAEVSSDANGVSCRFIVSPR